MNRPRAARTSWFTVLLVIAAVALWALDQKRAADTRHGSAKPGNRSQTSPSQPELRRPGKSRAAEQPETSGQYEVLRKCTLAEDHSNDGDSFRVRLPDGRQEVFRLYFVDTPESAFRRYAGGDTNHERIRQQAADLGGIRPEQAVEIGKKAKTLSLELLERAPFTIHTCWDSPYHDKRYHAFVEVRVDGEARWLHELLVERGLARIKTKPADLPDGTPASRQRDRLRELERKAKREQTGVWGL